ncbi:asparaginase [Pseudonocardia sp. HH130630-07]|uniref:asparaginase n=1 Tax=Pseudonocardia sp. HH130630-07 TaxID=1690815 RepID=UPI000814E610|nr:asparaginase [Pseudonocardia sp. HH130630-07]ANY08053.1 asparaginase [Pseudonocardia sp. HH130630-07]
MTAANTPPVLTAAVPLAYVDREGTVESVHLGTVAVLDADGRITGRGDPGVRFLPRSALKPVQAVALLRAGLDLDGELLALACASHSGEAGHVEGVRRILGGAGLTEDDLDNTPDLPLSADAAAGAVPAPILQNCSGKHAAMLAACVAAGWPTTGYRDPEHPLQRLVRDTVADLTGVAPAITTVDGCGAPLFDSTPAGLATAFARIAVADPATPEGRVGAAVRAHPWWVGGTGRPVTGIAEAVPGLIAKDGAEGVLAAALPDGRALAVTVLDGSPRPLPVIAADVLTGWGAGSAELDAAGRADVLGHGRPVGAVRLAPR